MYHMSIGLQSIVHGFTLNDLSATQGKTLGYRPQGTFGLRNQVS